MAEEELKPPTPEQLKAEKERWQKMNDDALVARWQHFEGLAMRMLAIPGDERGAFDAAAVRHLAEMLLLLDIARGGNSFTRFRSRYGGNSETVW